MPLKAYVGLPRAGKSYEVCTQVILPALRQGRRVVSNIAGLNAEAFRSVLFAEGYPESKIGFLVHVDHEQVKQPSFWRTDTDNATGTESVIQPGDLVALDEIWRFWKKRGDIEPRCMNFFRMHGHFPHPVSGLTCEVALITQSVRDINENIRDVIAETFLMEKNTKLGSDKSYIVHIFQRGSTSKVDFIRTLPPRFYNSDYFALYKSHSQQVEGDAKAQEKNPDKRGNILHGALFKIGFPFALICLVLGLWGMARFLFPSASVPNKLTPETPDDQVVAVPVQIVHTVNVPEVVQSWRVVGHYRSGGSFVVLIGNQYGAMRSLVNPPNFQFLGSGVSVLLPEGGFATSWTTFNQKAGIL